MAIREKLPPSGRDFEVYRLATIGEMPTRQIAAEVKISQTRVVQIVSRVAKYLLEVCPGVDEGEQHAKRLGLGMQIAAERVDHLYGMALKCFRATQGKQIVIREVGGAGRPNVT